MDLRLASLRERLVLPPHSTWRYGSCRMRGETHDIGRGGRMMEPVERAGLESRIHALHDAGEKKLAATALLEGYGRELLTFLVAHLRDRDAAAEVFSQFTEDLWRGLNGF